MKKIIGSVIAGGLLAALIGGVVFPQGAAPLVQIIFGGAPVSQFNPFPTSAVGPTGFLQGVTPTGGGARVAQDPTQLMWDDYRGGGGPVGTGVLDTVFNWQTPTTGGTGSPTAANNQFGATSLGSGTGTGFSILKSQESFKGVNPGWLYFQEQNNFEFPIILNAVRFWGFATLPTTPTTAASYTDAEGFELGTDGHLRAITSASADSVSAGTRLVINDLSLPCPATVAFSGSIPNASPTLTIPSGVVAPFTLVTGPGIPFATTVLTVAGSTITLSSNSTAAKSGSYTFTGQCAPGLVGTVPQPQDANTHMYKMDNRGDRIFWSIDGIDNVVAQTYSGALGPGNNALFVTHLAVGNTPASSATIGINATIIGDSARNPYFNGFMRDRTITSASGASQQLFAANLQRHSITIVNTGNANCGINPSGGTAAIGGAGTFTLAALGSYSPRIPPRQAVTVICTAGQPIYGDEN
jgi:hypothetical protein